MKKFQLYNNISGWVVFLVATVTYLLTIEPTTSLWDCGEFITSSYKLQVGHPPGAPLFMIMARFFSLFASDVSQVAKMINAMSGLASAFTILFLFWTISHLGRKIIMANSEEEISRANIFIILGSAVVGSLAYTFSDTFWFSAVEAEVYATSSLFTAVVFWAILKWENIADEKYANRWLILIAYLMGLSIGVHLLNLLAIPAIVFVYYFRKFKVTRRGIFYAAVISVMLLAIMMYGVIHGVVKVASIFELVFVNQLGLPYKSGVILYTLLLIGLVAWGIIRTKRNGKVVLNTALTAFMVILIGYSSFTMIVIRSLADPPIDENNPEHVFSLLSYLNREQYGDRPLVKGQYYNAPIEEVVDGKKVYNQIDGKYEVTQVKREYIYDPRFNTFFPRMYSSDTRHIREYKDWASIKGVPVQVQNRQGETETIYKPTFGENLKFFFRYQVGFMYFRYFMWNFSGRQNDEQSHGEITNGNWITGIKPFDEVRIGSRENFPESMENEKSTNKYYMLPFLLGLMGVIFHFQKNKKDATVVMLLFILTGLAIVVYLNQTPIQPRERDYAYAGSFYAYAIWIGLGVMAIFDLFSRKNKTPVTAALVTLLCLIFVPGLMAKENWDDHDRSGRYTARDFAYNYLNSCAPNAILFTNGDNDTFPLWYAQEVEGIRTDVRVVNLMLLNTDWYIEQMKRKAYESEPVPFSMEKEQYIDGRRNIVYLLDRVKNHVNLKDAIDFVRSDDPKTKQLPNLREKIDYIPTKRFILPVDSAIVVKNGTVKPEDAHLVEKEIRFTLNKSHIMKSEMMVLDLLAHNNWERPVYFVAPGSDGTVNLDDYLQLEGFAYRLLPIRKQAEGYLDYGRIDTDILYRNLMQEFRWGRMNKEDVYIDYYNRRTISVLKIRNTFNRLAEKLLEEAKTDSAIEVLNKVVELTPHENVPYDIFMVETAELYYQANTPDQANKIVKNYASLCFDYLDYYFGFRKKFIPSVENEINMNMQIVQRLLQLTQRFGQTELNQEIQEEFDKVHMVYQSMGIGR